MESVEIRGIAPQDLRANKLALVERLADDLAHEIKNPLHSMVINLEVLKRRVARSTADDASDLMRYVGVLASELDRVNRRVELLLRMVRPERSGDPVPLTEAVDELLEVVELERERQAIEIEVVPPQHALRANLPRNLGRQIVLNLLVIALDAAGPGGTLTICCARGGAEDHLRIVARAAPAADRVDSSGVEEDRVRRSTVQTLAESLGGRVDISTVDDADREAVDIVFALPASAA
jgi:signal transduction histidine kinase